MSSNIPTISESRSALRKQQPSSHYPLPVEQQSKSVYGLDDISASATAIQRQDSGYESTTPYERQPRISGMSHRHASSTTSSRTDSRTRPAARRAAKSGSSVSRLPKTSKLSSRAPLIHSANAALVTVTPSGYSYGYHNSNPYDSAETSYLHFPPPEPHLGADEIFPHPNSPTHDDFYDSYAYPVGNNYNNGRDDSYNINYNPVYQAPPQTTHYWTSDQTRRLEYAAIDAASRGFKGWMLRHMVPDCFVPKAKRRVTFDDDTGSVRRYRIELETEESLEKDCVSSMMDRGHKKGSSSGWWS
ncbi:MAG: hypothetical protein STHCBS139747_007793 [Sporothrix thermara]